MSQATAAVPDSSSRRRRRRYVVIAPVVVVLAVVAFGVWRWQDQALLRAAESAYAQDDLERAFQLAREFLRSHHDDPKASRLIALCLSRLGLPREAERYFAAAGNRLTAEDCRLRAQALLGQGLPKLAADALVETLQRWPDDPSALRHLAVIRVQQGNFPEAIDLASRLSQVPSESARGYALLGTIYRRAGRASDTIDCYLETIRLDPELSCVPDRLDFFKGMAMSFHELDRLEEAEQYYRRALEVRREAETLRYLGVLKSESGDTAGAERYWREALEEDPSHVDALMDLGKLMLSRDQVEEAVELLERAVASDPQSRAAHYLLSLAYERAGDPENARIHREKAEKLR